MKHKSLLLLIMTIMLAGFASGPTWASDSKDHERARAALEAGQIQPLAQILTEVERRYLGRVIETELDRDNGRWVYDFKLLPPTGQVFKLEVDATTGALLHSKGSVQERR